MQDVHYTVIGFYGSTFGVVANGIGLALYHSWTGIPFADFPSKCYLMILGVGTLDFLSFNCRVIGFQEA